MQDVFSGKAQLPGQQDEDMQNQENIPDDVAEVVGGQGRPVVDLDEALNQAELQMETDPELRQHMEAIQRHIDQLKVGDLVDFRRAPFTKDISGRSGPATVVNVSEVGRGNIDVRWQSHFYSVSVRHVRRALVYRCPVISGRRNCLLQDASFGAIKNRVHPFPNGRLITVSALWTQQHWQ